jgi:CheY-like chemotaxis protein
MLLPSQNSFDRETTPELRPLFEFLVVSKDNPVFQSVAAAIHQIKGRLDCTPSVATARDYVAWRKVDGIVVDLSLPGALELIRRVRGASPNRFSAIFACIGSPRETQVAIDAGANFVLHRPLLPDKIARVLNAATDLMVAEKRRHLRHPLMVPVELRMKEREVESTMSNLSEGGMAIWSLYYYAPGSAIQFAFEIPFGGLIRGEGDVAWTNADGLAGIRFRTLSDQASAHLSAWIARRHPVN